MEAGTGLAGDAEVGIVGEVARGREFKDNLIVWEDGAGELRALDGGKGSVGMELLEAIDGKLDVAEAGEDGGAGEVAVEAGERCGKAGAGAKR